ncbi:unnamed protein product [Orchesella dallaii]|uniref:Uncharacterized protein n=1 Tax=Orchesella dallaii TaxID=48710 RepID=A0ABP1RVI6_9HEXA
MFKPDGTPIIPDQESGHRSRAGNTSDEAAGEAAGFKLFENKFSKQFDDLKKLVLALNDRMTVQIGNPTTESSSDKGSKPEKPKVLKGEKTEKSLAVSKKLFSRKQKLDEAFESFAWEIHVAYRKIQPDISEDRIVSRIVNSCLPELASELRGYSFSTVQGIIIRARELIMDLNKIRSFEGKVLLRARQTDKIAETKQKQKFKYENKVDNKQPEPGCSVKHPNDKSSRFQYKAKNSNWSKSKFFCSYCGIPNHHETQCRNKERDIADMHKQSEGNGKEGDSPPFIPRTSQTGSQAKNTERK